MEIDVKKLMPEVTDNHFETIDLLLKANQEIIEALHIMQSTIENFYDAEILLINKERMVKYFNKYAKDEILSK
jgi:predicted XRE-type DNA-binding protein